MAKELDYDTVKAYQNFMDSEDESDKEKSAYVKGIWFEEEYLRKYPYLMSGRGPDRFYSQGKRRHLGY